MNSSIFPSSDQDFSSRLSSVSSGTSEGKHAGIKRPVPTEFECSAADYNGGFDSDENSAQIGNGKKTRGRVRIRMQFIDNKLRRYTTFSKRKTGIMKKAYELATLTGTQVMLLVASETGHVYTFATKKLQPMITSESGKALIQTCLNSPDNGVSIAHMEDDSRMNPNGFEETELNYMVPEDDMVKVPQLLGYPNLTGSDQRIDDGYLDNPNSSPEDLNEGSSNVDNSWINLTQSENSAMPSLNGNSPLALSQASISQTTTNPAASSNDTFVVSLSQSSSMTQAGAATLAIPQKIVTTSVSPTSLQTSQANKPADTDQSLTQEEQLQEQLAKQTALLLQLQQQHAAVQQQQQQQQMLGQTTLIQQPQMLMDFQTGARAAVSGTTFIQAPAALTSRIAGTSGASLVAASPGIQSAPGTIMYANGQAFVYTPSAVPQTVLHEGYLPLINLPQQTIAASPSPQYITIPLSLATSQGFLPAVTTAQADQLAKS